MMKEGGEEEEENRKKKTKKTTKKRNIEKPGPRYRIITETGCCIPSHSYLPALPACLPAPPKQVANQGSQASHWP